MNKRKDCCLNKNLLWLFLLPLLWFALSMWHYKCNIQKVCSVDSTAVTKTTEVKKTIVAPVAPVVEKIEEEVKKEVVVKKEVIKETPKKKEIVKTKTVVENNCKGVLHEFIAFEALNNPDEVKILENFLNQYEGEHLKIDGVYSKTDMDAVKRFQLKYNNDILANSTIWEDINQKPTGYVYKTTRKKINEIYCSKQKN